jgi:hypothetical protein
VLNQQRKGLFTNFHCPTTPLSAPLDQQDEKLHRSTRKKMDAIENGHSGLNYNPAWLTLRVSFLGKELKRLVIATTRKNFCLKEFNTTTQHPFNGSGTTFYNRYLGRILGISITNNAVEQLR